MGQEFFFNNTTFINSDGKSLYLDEIISEKNKIISITLAFLRDKRNVPHEGFLGKLKIKKIIWSEKIEKINDTTGIICNPFCGKFFSISFSSKEEFDKIKDDYNINTLWKQCKKDETHPYRIDFLYCHLINIDWVEK